jgi:hypothetical protein
LLVGCSHLPFNRSTPQAQGLRPVGATPTAAELVSILNENAHKVQSVQCRDVDLDCTADGQSVGLRAIVFCQKPRNFRMSAKVMGNVAADMGSNDREFWYWISRAEPPYLYHCSYADFSRGLARLPFPFQPDWIIEAMGIAEFDPNKQYEVAANGQNIDLLENTLSPQGQPVRKITRLTRSPNGQLMVSSHMLQSAKGDPLCAAYISEVHRDPATGVLLPRRVLLDWPAEKMRMKMRLDDVVVNPPMLAPDRTPSELFVRPNWGTIQSYDLARGPDAQGGPLRAAGGYR